MNRVITWTAALTVLVAGFAVVGTSQAEAGLFNRNKCSKQAKKCRTPRRSRNECCQPAPTCCEAAPCEAAAPCVEATPACGGCEQTACCPSRRDRRKARKSCCAQTCGYTTQGCSSCGTAVQGCSSCGGQAVEGCSNCGGAAVEAPTPAPEAAPEAPEGDSTT